MRVNISLIYRELIEKKYIGNTARLAATTIIIIRLGHPISLDIKNDIINSMHNWRNRINKINGLKGFSMLLNAYAFT